MPRNKGVAIIRKEAHLYNFIPTTRDDYGVHHIRAKAHARHPTRVIKTLKLMSKRVHIPLSVTILFDVVFALSKSVPEFDTPVARTRHDLPVVSAEADGEDVGCVANESAGG
jgi:hypothetical protein